MGDMDSNKIEISSLIQGMLACAINSRCLSLGSHDVLRSVEGGQSSKRVLLVILIYLNAISVSKCHFLTIHIG
jgi:hypothetical protein